VQGLLVYKKHRSIQTKYMSKEEKRNDRFESYPRPSETDKQLQNQPEFQDQQPNDFGDKSISDVPNSNAEHQSDDPQRETKRDREKDK
jgi:hypothetical protein